MLLMSLWSIKCFCELCISPKKYFFHFSISVRSFANSVSHLTRPPGELNSKHSTISSNFPPAAGE